jgi:hypothetical protein
MSVQRGPTIWTAWHWLWAATVASALLLNVFWPVYPGYSVWALALIAYPAGAAVILVNRPGNRVGRALAVVAMSAGVAFGGAWVVRTWEGETWSVYLEAIVGTAIPVLFWGVIAILYVFPTGTFSRPAFRAVFTAFSVVVAVMALLGTLTPGPLLMTGRINPLGGPSWVGPVYDAGISVLLPGVLVGVWAAITRFRSASPEVRLQLRWFMFGMVAVAGMVVVVGFVPETLPSPYEQLSGVAIVAGFWSLPLAIVVAITRYRLYEIDRLVSRTITYTIVVGLLLGTYLALATLIAGLLPTQDSFAVATSTLSAAVLFNPLRRRIQSAVDKRFNRSAYQANSISEEFAAKLREPLVAEQLVDTWRATVEGVLQPNLISIWLADGRGKQPEDN